MGKKVETYSPEMYLDIEEEHIARPKRVTIYQTVDGTHSAIVNILKSGDIKGKAYVQSLFDDKKATLSASWLYDDLDDQYKASIDLRNIPKAECKELIIKAYKIMIRKMNEPKPQKVVKEEKVEKRQVTIEEYLETLLDKKGLTIKESVLGTNKSIINIFNKSNNKEFKNTILDIINRYVIIKEEFDLKIDGYKRCCLVDLRDIPSSIARKIKRLSRQLDSEIAENLRKAKTEEKQKYNTEKNSYIESLNKFKK